MRQDAPQPRLSDRFRPSKRKDRSRTLDSLEGSEIGPEAPLPAYEAHREKKQAQARFWIR
jgi:hypothetical protein